MQTSFLYVEHNNKTFLTSELRLHVPLYSRSTLHHSDTSGSIPQPELTNVVSASPGHIFHTSYNLP